MLWLDKLYCLNCRFFISFWNLNPFYEALIPSFLASLYVFYEGTIFPAVFTTISTTIFLISVTLVPCPARSLQRRASSSLSSPPSYFSATHWLRGNGRELDSSLQVRGTSSLDKMHRVSQNRPLIEMVKYSCSTQWWSGR